MTSINLDIDAENFQESLIFEIKRPTSNKTIRIIGDCVLKHLELQLKNEVRDGKIVRFKAEWYRPSVRNERRNPSLLELSKDSIIELGYYVVDVVTNLEHSCILNINPPKNITFSNSTTIKTKTLKTICKHKIRLYEVGLKGELLNPVINAFGTSCECPPNYLVPHIDGVWDNALQFNCKVCGKSYFCECFRLALEEIYNKIIATDKSSYGRGSLDHRLVTAFEESEFREGICHLCRDIPSELFYCHPQYGSKVLVHYGPYIAKIAIEKNIEQRDAENEIRDILGIPRIGEGWISEVELLNLVKQIYPEEVVIHQGSPEWLGRQRLDIYIPNMKLAIEYQGRQHYEPVDFFGGKEGFEQTQKRDRIKAKKCSLNGIELIYFRYNGKSPVQKG